MRIAIFGDSYACRSASTRARASLSWPEWLQSRGHIVDIWAASGTCFWFTYRRFLEHCHNYTSVVVLVTAYHRQPIRDEPLLSTVNTDHLQWWIEQSPPGHQRQKLRAARDHHLWAQHHQYTWDAHTLMMDRILARAPGALLIPCFPMVDSWSHSDQAVCPRVPQWQGLSLWDISQLDHLHYGMDIGRIREDHRHCHINDHNNRRLALDLEHWIMGGPLPLQSLEGYAASSEPQAHYFDLLP